ncbi:riboflavin biosynthesis protein RibF [Opitutus terrae]|uniref:Riboflavin biosynthesis protein n=1 Tax=Opitutus terrae (strain DSM 11246 / JCM 15787 / PB90-1) TaxID=452637 RepID=B1ZX47_OPITP|nr:riboflavin biosynthesis protein RibF [Opitutus terrae]ACB76099.1 riboflavin biosynthesis protein RibF [Opitutus terrae PB90-1]
MNAPRQFDALEHAQLASRPVHLAIGIFDGVHLGHAAVIEAAVQSARRSNGQSAVLTFDPHPSVILRPAEPTRLLMNRSAKARVLGRLGIEAVINQPFTVELAAMEAVQFVPWLKQHVPQLAGIYVGENWRFGRGRRGDIALLVNEGRKVGVSVFSAPRVSLDGEPISSSRIRAAVTAGEIAAANAMLGYVYFAEGRVVPGNKLGRTMGFPTLNLAWAPDLQPRFGVYVVRVTGTKSTAPLRAVANYGARPTVEKAAEPRLEVHLLDECPYDAGDEITVEWLHFLRPEMKFGGLGTLRAQIAADREAALAFFAK